MIRRKPTDEDLRKRVKALEREVRKAKRAELALKIQNAYLELFFESAPEAIVLADKNHRINRINPQFTKMFGYDPEEAIGRTVDELIAGKDKHEEAAQITRQVGRGETVRTEGFRYTRKGLAVCVELMAAPVCAEDEQIATYASYRDITERKRIEAALRKSEEQYRTLIENIPVGVYRCKPGPHGRFLMANPAFLRMFGFASEQELKKISVSDIYMDPSRRKDFSDDLLRDKSLLASDRHLKKKDGTPLWAVVSARVAHHPSSGRVSHFDCVIADITEKKLAEQRILDSEKRYRELIEGSRDGYALADLSGRIMDSNSAFRELLGFTEEELAGKTYEDLTPERWRAVESKILKEQVFKRGYSDVFEKVYVRKNGTTLPAELRVCLRRDERGNPAGTWAFVRDVTERHRAEDERRKLEAQLHLAQRMHAIGTLAGGIAHDFNNILMGIQGRTSLMLLEVDSSHPHFEHLKGIEQYVGNAAALTRQLLGFARGGKYEVKPTDLNELIQRNTYMFGRAKKEIRIHGKYQEEIWPAEVDQSQIEQVLLNLFVNAWQAMPGGGDLYIETQNVVLSEEEADPHEAKAGRYVKVTVADTGVGMDEQTRQRIFEPFFTTKEMGRGTGLGLASAYGIIKNHGGIIEVDSDMGAGTSFRLYLPASDKGILKESGFDGEAKRGSEGVLLVDDEEMIRSVVKKMLEGLGYRVWVAANEEEAIEQLRNKRGNVDLVILDMIMPGSKGGKVFEALRRLDPGIKVLLSSGYSLDKEARKIMDRGCDGFIQKPFTVKSLSTKIREVLGDGKPPGPHR